MTENRQDERIEPGAEVIGSGGEKLGSVEYVVVRPPELAVTDIVVSTGAILGRDVVVPIDAVDRIDEGKVYLRVDRDQLEKYPNYVDVEYETPPAGWVAPGGIDYPPGAIVWPTGLAPYAEPRAVKVNTPAGTVGLHQGMDVESSDGHKVGSVDALDLDPETDDVSAIVVKHGFLFTQDVRIPVDRVADVSGGAIKLNLSKDELESYEKGQSDLAP